MCAGVFVCVHYVMMKDSVMVLGCDHVAGILCLCSALLDELCTLYLKEIKHVTLSSLEGRKTESYKFLQCF